MEKILITLLIIGFCITIFFIIQKNIKGSKSKNINKNEIKNKWAEIESIANNGKEMYYKMAIIEADKLLDDVFKKLGTPGSTMGERLKFLIYKYPGLKKVWEAHIIRNNISHESNYELYKSTAQRALSIYKNALKELGAL